MGDEVYRKKVTQGLHGAHAAMGKNDDGSQGVTLPSLMGVIVVAVHQPDPMKRDSNGEPRLHVATNLTRLHYEQAFELLAIDYVSTRKESDGYVHHQDDYDDEEVLAIMQKAGEEEPENPLPPVQRPEKVPCVIPRGSYRMDR